MRFLKIGFSLSLASLALTAPSTVGWSNLVDVVTFSNLLQANSSLSDWHEILQSFGSPPPDTFVHLGDDGVLRGFNLKGDVLNYAGLDPEQIGAILSSTAPFHTDLEKAHLINVYNGIDGRAVDSGELTKPGPSIFPQHLFDNLPAAVNPAQRDTLSKAHLPRQDCGHAACKLGVDDCSAYPGCSQCVVLDMAEIGSCE
jgi:hypothetical protein